MDELELAVEPHPDLRERLREVRREIAEGTG